MSTIVHKFKQPNLSKSQLHNDPLIRQYQANLKVFLEKVDKEVLQLISKYENQIKILKKENDNLKDKLRKYQYHQTSNPEQFRQTTCSLKIQNISPVHKQKNRVSLSRLQLKNMSSKKDSFFGSKDFKSYLQYQAEDLSSSRFQVEKNKKKMHQQTILNSLQAGKNNLVMNTTKMFDLLGKSQSKQENIESSEEEQQVKSTEEKKQSLNHSLSSACQSLDNSFHGKKSKKKNEQKRKQKQKLKQMRLQQARKNYKQTKQQGLKNLLKVIRQNVTSVQQKPIQTLKTLKVANSAYETDPLPTSSKSINKSKVLIDPNPIDMQRKPKSRNGTNTSLNQSPHKIQSILKQSSNILSKSILNSSSSLN